MVMNVYRPQWMSSVLDFVDELADIVASLSSSATKSTGQESTTHPSTSSLLTCFQSLELTELVAEPTRCVQGLTAHLLDVLATSRPALISDVKVSDTDFLSDHRLVCTTVATRAVKPVVVRASRNIRSINMASLSCFQSQRPQSTGTTNS